MKRVVLGLALLTGALALATVGRSSAATCFGEDSFGIGSLPTVKCPIPGARQASLAQAADVLGAPLALPSSAKVGAVWSSRGVHSKDGQSVAVTYPSRGFAVRYTTPAPYRDAIANYRSYARSVPSARVVFLRGVPALTESSRGRRRWGFVEFASHGTMIAVMGTAGQSVLQGAARSILSRLGA